MSDYYDDGPFKIDQWNALISDINDVLADPPEGCDPVTTMDEVEDPYIWLVEDVEELRSKMIETCPDIKFEEELEIWKTAIIDEIESQIPDMWCTCEECDAPEVNMPIATVRWTQIDACPTADRCGDIWSGTCYYCIGMDWALDSHSGTWYPPLEGANVVAWNKICATYTTANQKYLAFILAVNTTQQKACQLEKEQNKLDTDILPQLDAAITEYLGLNCDTTPAEEDIPRCEELRNQICDLGGQAQDQQEVIDDKHAEYLTEFAKIDPARLACDADAAENMAACLLLVTRFPVEWQGMQWLLPQITALEFDWWKWFNPKRDTIIANWGRANINNDDYLCEPALASSIAECAYSSKGCLKYPNHQSCGVRPSVTIDKFDSYMGRITKHEHIRLSPNGTPFLSYGQADMLLVDRTVRSEEVTSSHRCDAPQPSCPTPCIMGPATTLLWSWYGGDLESRVCGDSRRECLEHTWCAMIFSGVVNTVEIPSSYLEYRPSYKAITGRIGKDYTEDRDEFYLDHKEWFSEENHPKYDDRHEDYC